MSSTYSVGKKAAAIVAPNGTIFYGLFEETYESNVFPQTPHWSAIFFGTAKACMREIILRASAAEGGCLKEKGGHTTPSAYIKHWREALSNPSTLRRGVVSASFGPGIYTLDEEKRSSMASLLQQYGHPGIDGDRVSINLDTQPELLAAIVADGHYPWRFLKESDAGWEPADWAAYKPTACKGEIPDFTVFSLQDRPNHDAEHWVVVNDVVKQVGWEYSLIGHLITNYVTASEAKHPGSAENAIRQIRAMVKNAVPLPMEQRVHLDRSKADHNWRLSPFDNLAQKLGAEGAQVIDTTIREVLEAKAVYEFKSLSDSMVQFIDLPSPIIGIQQDLLAA